MNNVLSEIRKIHWLNKRDLLKNFIRVVLIIGFFALLFMIIQGVISVIITLIK